MRAAGARIMKKSFSATKVCIRKLLQKLCNKSFLATKMCKEIVAEIMYKKYFDHKNVHVTKVFATIRKLL